MGFKEQIASDISVFLSFNEFGDTHNINGTDYVVIVDNDLLEEKENKKGVYIGDVLFHIATNDFERPDPNSYGQSITFDDQTYQIVSAIDNKGMTTVILTSDLGNKFVVVKYRLKEGVGANPLFGIPGIKQDWSEASIITPNPHFEEIRNQFTVEEIGTITTNDVKIKIQKALFTRTQLKTYEFLINNSVYDTINGQILEDAFFWTLYLRKQA